MSNLNSVLRHMQELLGDEHMIALSESLRQEKDAMAAAAAADDMPACQEHEAKVHLITTRIRFCIVQLLKAWLQMFEHIQAAAAEIGSEIGLQPIFIFPSAEKDAAPDDDRV